MPQSFSSQDKTLIKSVDLQSRSELVITENCLKLTLDLIVDLQHKCLQHVHLLALHLEIEGYTTLLLYLLLTPLLFKHAYWLSIAARWMLDGIALRNRGIHYTSSILTPYTAAVQTCLLNECCCKMDA